MKKKWIVFVLSVVCALSLTVGLTAVGFASERPVNLALDESQWIIGSNAPQGGVTFSAADGIGLQNYSNEQSASVYVKDALTETFKFSATFCAKSPAGKNEGWAVLQLMSAKATGDILNWNNTGGTGRALIFEMRPGWLSVKVKDIGKYDVDANVVTIADGNGRGEGIGVPEDALSGGAALLDGTDHALVFEKTNTASGIRISLSVDGKYYLRDADVAEPALRGDTWLGLGIGSFDAGTFEDENHFLKISSAGLELSVRPENLAVDAENWIVGSTALEGGVLLGTEGISSGEYSAGHSASVFYHDPLTATTKLTLRFSGKSSNSASGRLIVQLMSGKATGDVYNHNNAVGVSGRALIFTAEPGWLSVKVKDIGKYDADANVLSVADGNGRGEGIGTPENPLSGAAALLDGTPHTLVLEKADTSSGITVSLSVDGKYYLENAAIAEPALRGETYLGIGLGAFDGGPYGGADNYLSVSEVNLSPKPERTFESTLDKENFGGFGSNLEGSVTYDESGARLSGWTWKDAEGNQGAHAAGIYYRNPMAPTSKFTLQFAGNLDFTEDFADIATTPSTGVHNVFSVVLNKTDAFDSSNPYPFRTGSSAGGYLVLELSRNNNKTNHVSLSVKRGGSWDNKMLDRRYPESAAAEDLFDDSVNLFDGKLHTLEAETGYSAEGLSLTVRIDGKIFTSGVYSASDTKIGEEELDWRGNYYISAFANTNFVCDKGVVTDQSEYVRIVGLTTEGEAVVDETDPASDYDPAQNLVKNKWNFSLNPTLVTLSEDGLKFINIPTGAGSGFCLTNAKLNQFDYAMKFNSRLVTDQDVDPSNPGYFADMRLCFMIDRANPVYSNFSPYYYDVTIGRNDRAFGANVDSFVSVSTYKGYSDSSVLKPWKTYKTNVGINDGGDHWFELKVRNYRDGTEQGVEIKVYLDGKLTLSLRDPDCKETETVGNDTVSYDKQVYGRKGYIGMNTGSDGSTAEALASTFAIRELYLKSYDDSSEGEYAPQGTEPEFEILPNIDFKPENAYYIGEDIVLNLSTLFLNQGEYELSYEVVKNNTTQAVGTLTGSTWKYTPAVEEFFTVRVTASSAEHSKSAYLLVDINIIQDEVGGGSGDREPETPGKGCGSPGCGGSAAALPILAALALAVKRFR